MFPRYGHKEGWVPSVYLKRVGNASVFPAKSLRRLTAMGLQLRDDEMDGSLNGELQGGALPNGNDRRIIDYLAVSRNTSHTPCCIPRDIRQIRSSTPNILCAVLLA